MLEKIHKCVALWLATENSCHSPCSVGIRTSTPWNLWYRVTTCKEQLMYHSSQRSELQPGTAISGFLCSQNMSKLLLLTLSLLHAIPRGSLPRNIGDASQSAMCHYGQPQAPSSQKSYLFRASIMSALAHQLSP
ncbi:Uncharacterized protein HZ326_13185 [Fusarium oxysporum f. sp. albedinis]|nr:Uncharacterized protein HZ326_13185 [Fusarium oxysporum f. sp. albedinis]